MRHFLVRGSYRKNSQHVYHCPLCQVLQLQDLVWILYSDLNLSRLPPLEMDVVAFFMKTHRESRYQFPQFVIPSCASHGVSSSVIEPLEDSGIEEDQLIEMEFEEDSGTGDQLMAKALSASSKAKRNHPLVKRIILFFHVQFSIIIFWQPSGIFTIMQWNLHFLLQFFIV